MCGKSCVGVIRPTRTRGGLMKPMLVVALFCLLATSAGFGQTASSSPSANQNLRAPMSHLYWHFLLHQQHLDKTAASREQQGKDGSWLRTYYQQRLGFSDSQFSNVREAAVQLKSDLKQIDDEVQAIIRVDRARHSRVLLSTNDLPSVPPRLMELRDQREAVIQRDMDNLRGALGPKLAAKLDAFLENDFAPNVKIQYVGPPRQHDPSKEAVPPFPTEVQR